VLLDLASQASAGQVAKEIAGLTDKLDIIINNAGINLTGRQIPPERIELTYATNQLGRS
jgi:NAD(P)-dependent dehydrogenase (short-subunit alcohol dehydrogenase family)